MNDETSDEKLLKRASRGDEAAFLELYERHWNSVFRFALRMLGSQELAEDIAQDCFLSLIRRPRAFDPSRGSLSRYLYAAARNLAYKQLRLRGKLVTIDDSVDDLGFGIGSADVGSLRKLLDEERSSKVQHAIGSLPELQREALILFEYEQLSLAEVAEVVGADVGTVKSRLHRARRRIRTLLAPYMNDDTKAVAGGKCRS